MPAELDGSRADLVVARLAAVPRARAKRAAGAGGITRGQEKLAASDRVAVGDVLEVELPAEEDFRPEPVPFDVVWEDGHMAVVDKPPGIVVHPGAGVTRGTLAAGLLHRWPQIEGVGEPRRWGIVHRLDRDTSGLLLVAKTPPALHGLRRLLKARKVDRTYLALVAGRPEFTTGSIDAPIRRDPDRPIKMALAPDGRPARTHYRLARTWEEPPTSLLEISLETGRTHQIRVHLASIGHPLIGDRLYGSAKEPTAPRVFLHASELRWTHPVTGEDLEASSPLPADLQSVLDELG